jgi:hypothetical protein
MHSPCLALVSDGLVPFFWGPVFHRDDYPVVKERPREHGESEKVAEALG